MACCKKFRGCTHRGSQDDEYVCVGVAGLLLSIELPPELSKHLRASQRLSAHRLAHLVSQSLPTVVTLTRLRLYDTYSMVKSQLSCFPCRKKTQQVNAATYCHKRKNA